MTDNIKYCNSLTNYSRFVSREVPIGDIPLGGSNPIRIQSMTTTDTMDTIATVKQTIRMVESGCDYVRITAPSIKEAKNLEVIKKELQKQGYRVPLIADIHFTPNAAEYAARIVEKVRVNPGNYIDKKKFQTIEYTDKEYAAELENLHKRFSPLVKICKEYGTAMRIGANHGSLSDRIMSRFGDSPLGMVESAMEFINICRQLDYHNIVLSMKSSNTRVMVQAYRLLVNRMINEGINYPLHLGVTEAGDGEDGRVKSALGIGYLLEDGLGDTIRVSLTEEPEFEAPVAIKLANRYSNRGKTANIKEIEKYYITPFEYNKRVTGSLSSMGGSNLPCVIADFSKLLEVSQEDLASVGYTYNSLTDKWSMSDSACDFLYLKEKSLSFTPPGGLKLLYDYNFYLKLNVAMNDIPVLTQDEYLDKDSTHFFYCLVKVDAKDFNDDFFSKLKTKRNAIILLTTNNPHGAAEQRRFINELSAQNITCPVVIYREYSISDFETLMLHSASDVGGLLVDGFGDGIWLNISDPSYISLEDINRLQFNILQAARVRISKTEYIACPSCGRTLFDLMETTEKVRARTGHLKGLKIAIMGCIVNGPGEMADADYGYVGSGLGKITLYRGKEVVRKSINSEKAVDTLIELIKEDNNWVEKS